MLTDETTATAVLQKLTVFLFTWKLDNINFMHAAYAAKVGLQVYWRDQ